MQVQEVFRREEGQVLVWVLLLLPLLLLLTAMLIEGGLMYRTYRVAQMAADAGAHAAAQELDAATYLRSGKVTLSAEATYVAQEYASANLRGPIHCGTPEVWGNRVHLRCDAMLQPHMLTGIPPVQVVVLGTARPAWGATQETQ